MTWLTDVVAAKAQGLSLVLPEGPLVGRGRALALAPHPDDPDAVAVTLRWLAAGGWDVSSAVLATGWSGVADDFTGSDPAAKAAAREAEQRASAELFGLPDDRLTFLRLSEDAGGCLVDSADNAARAMALLHALRPSLVLLPYFDDTNADHRLVARWFAAWAPDAGAPVAALYNEDPKSLHFRPDVAIRFGAETAAWKARLLECHRSQSVRNMAQRGITFAERIVGMNRDDEGYAERFVLRVWG